MSVPWDSYGPRFRDSVILKQTQWSGIWKRWWCRADDQSTESSKIRVCRSIEIDKIKVENEKYRWHSKIPENLQNFKQVFHYHKDIMVQ